MPAHAEFETKAIQQSARPELCSGGAIRWPGQGRVSEVARDGRLIRAV
jgi:hypothetical protein